MTSIENRKSQESEAELNRDPPISKLYQVVTNQAFINKLRSSAQYDFLNSGRLGQRLESLNYEINSDFSDNQQTQSRLDRKKEFGTMLTNLIVSRTKWVCTIITTGSSMSGLGANNSDADMCLYAPSLGNKGDKDDEKILGINILQIIRHIIFHFDEEEKAKGSAGTGIVELEFLHGAAIPLLKMKTRDELEIDLSVCTREFLSGLQNTFLLKGYGKCDTRFAPLCCFIKKWASATGVKNPVPSVRRFNSYALTMLVIHFLQCGVHPPVLPNLQSLYPSSFAQNEETFPLRLDFDNPLPTPLPEGELNTQVLIELFAQFLIYYKDFDWRRFYPSLRSASIKERNRDDAFVRSHSAATVFIEDPIDQHNPGRTVADYNYIKNVMEKTLDLLKQSVEGDAHQVPSLTDLVNIMSKPQQPNVASKMVNT